MLLMWRPDGLKDIMLAFKHRPLRKSTPISKPLYVKPPFLEQTWSPLIAQKKKGQDQTQSKITRQNDPESLSGWTNHVLPCQDSQISLAELIKWQQPLERRNWPKMWEHWNFFFYRLTRNPHKPAQIDEGIRDLSSHFDLTPNTQTLNGLPKLFDPSSFNSYHTVYPRQGDG